MGENSKADLGSQVGSEHQRPTVNIGIGSILIAVIIIVVIIVLALSWHKHLTSSKEAVKSPVANATAGQTITPASGSTLQIVGPSSATGNVTNSQGSTSSQVTYTATLDGKNNYCNGKQVAPSATGCTANGGVIFGAKPQILTKQGQDSTPK